MCYSLVCSASVFKSKLNHLLYKLGLQSLIMENNELSMQNVLQ